MLIAELRDAVADRLLLGRLPPGRARQLVLQVGPAPFSYWRRSMSACSPTKVEGGPALAICAAERGRAPVVLGGHVDQVSRFGSTVEETLPRSVVDALAAAPPLRAAAAQHVVGGQQRVGSCSGHA